MQAVAAPLPTQPIVVGLSHRQQGGEVPPCVEPCQQFIFSSTVHEDTLRDLCERRRTVESIMSVCLNGVVDLERLSIDIIDGL